MSHREAPELRREDAGDVATVSSGVAGGPLTRPQAMATHPSLAAVAVLVAATDRSLVRDPGAPSALLETDSREPE